MNEKVILRLHIVAKFMIAFLNLAFISGMIINLFITFPDIPNGIVVLSKLECRFSELI